jgi:hypothetical protein
LLGRTILFRVDEEQDRDPRDRGPRLVRIRRHDAVISRRSHVADEMVEHTIDRYLAVVSRETSASTDTGRGCERVGEGLAVVASPPTAKGSALARASSLLVCSLRLHAQMWLQ